MKSMNLLLALSIAVFASFALSACDDDNTSAAGNNFQIQNN